MYKGFKSLFKCYWREGVSFYRDRSNLEIDCVLHLKDGKYALIEFKLGSMEEEKVQKIYSN